MARSHFYASLGWFSIVWLYASVFLSPWILHWNHKLHTKKPQTLFYSLEKFPWILIVRLCTVNWFPFNSFLDSSREKKLFWMDINVVIIFVCCALVSHSIFLLFWAVNTFQKSKKKSTVYRLVCRTFTSYLAHSVHTNGLFAYLSVLSVV